jgi:hypothetical protein
MNIPMITQAEQKRSFVEVRDEIVAQLSKGQNIDLTLQEEAFGYIQERYPTFLSFAKAALARYHRAPQPLRAGAAAALLAYLSNAKA